MLNYERHLVVVLTIGIVIVVAAVAAVLLGVPLPFLGGEQAG